MDTQLVSALMFLHVGRTFKDADPKELMSKLEKAHLIEAKIKLLINPKEEDHVRLTSLIEKSIKVIYKHGEREEFVELLVMQDEIIALSQKILKREWDRVKKVD